MSDYQQVIFEDGLVSFDEYEQAMLDSARCIEDKGIPVDPLVLEGNRTYSLIFENPETLTDGEIDQGVAQCMTQFSSVVQMGWADEIADPGSEDEFDQILIDCLERNGITAQPSDFVAILESNPTVFDACSQEAIDQS